MLWLPVFFFCVPKRAYSKTHTATYNADELVDTVLRHTVHMREVLSEVDVRDFDLAQRALDSLKEENTVRTKVIDHKKKSRDRQYCNITTNLQT